MKLQTWAVILVLAMASAAHGALYGPYTTGFASGGNIPEGSTGGWSDTRNVGSVVIPGGMSAAVKVTFNISGGFNGDLKGYLGHNDVLIPLLNQVGTGTGLESEPTYYVGYGNAGFNNVTLADGGAGGDIHSYGGTGVPTGTYAPDSGGVTFAQKFGGLDPSGNWTISFFDLSTGGGTSQLTSWSLDITAVPEPVNVALSVFGGVFLAVIVVRNPRVQAWMRRRRGVDAANGRDCRFHFPPAI